MADSWLDHIPSAEREKIRKRMRSPEEYERLREKVKGPADLEKELRRSEQVAELSFALETEPSVHEKLKARLEQSMHEQGIENVLEAKPSPEACKALERGAFLLRIASHPRTHQDVLVVIPEGVVQEKIPVKASLSEGYMGQLLRSQS